MILEFDQTSEILFWDELGVNLLALSSHFLVFFLHKLSLTTTNVRENIVLIIV